MSSTVEESIEVDLPVSTVYNQWTQFEDFPQFMRGVTEVTQLSEDRLEWVAEIAGVRRRWEAKIVEQVPDQKIAWAATEGATNTGAVTFQDLGGRTAVHLSLAYEPEGLVEKVGDTLNVVENRARGDLERFKAFVEAEGYATGSHGTVNPAGAGGRPSIDDADSSRGDQGKAGVSGKAVAAGVGAAAAMVAGVAAAGKRSESTTSPEPVEPVEVTSPVPAAPASPASPPVGRVISYEEASEIVEKAQNLPPNETEGT